MARSRKDSERERAVGDAAEDALDEGLELTFPASDPVSVDETFTSRQAFQTGYERGSLSSQAPLAILRRREAVARRVAEPKIEALKRSMRLERQIALRLNVTPDAIRKGIRHAKKSKT